MKTSSCVIYEKTREFLTYFSPLLVILWTYFKYSQLELQMSITFQPQTTPFIFLWDHTQHSLTILNKHLGQMAHPSALYKEEFVKGPKVWCMKTELDLKDWACQGDATKSRKCFTIFADFCNCPGHPKSHINIVRNNFIPYRLCVSECHVATPY